MQLENSISSSEDNCKLTRNCNDEQYLGEEIENIEVGSLIDTQSDGSLQGEDDRRAFCYTPERLIQSSTYRIVSSSSSLYPCFACLKATSVDRRKSTENCEIKSIDRRKIGN